MKVLFITNLYPPIVVGGYELNCYDVARGLRARGHHMAVLTSAFRAGEAAGRAAGVSRSLRLLPTWDLGRPHTSVSDRWASLRAQRHNVRVVRRTLAELCPDAILVWNGQHLGHSLLSACEQSGRVAYYVADLWFAGALIPHLVPRRREQRRLAALARGLAGLPGNAVRSDRVIFNSRALRAQYAALGADVSRNVVIYPSIATDTFAPRPQHILQRALDEPYRLLYAGQVMAHKGVSTLVEALARLRARPGLEQTRLTVLGDGRDAAYLARLRARIGALGLEQAVEFMPACPRADVPARYAQHDALVFPSEWEEPFGLVLVEAMAAGLPVVTSLRGGAAEIVRDGQTAVAFAAGDAADLADKLAWTLTHAREAAALGQAAAAEAPRRFGLAAQVCAIEAYLQAMRA